MASGSVQGYSGENDDLFNAAGAAPKGPTLWTDDPNNTNGLAGMSFAGAGRAQGMQGTWLGEAADPYGNMAYESGQLANQEAQSRNYDQAGALQLARQAAMGNAPSAAAYQMQAGLNQAMANQAATAGGARGAAGLAMAQGNAAANAANMQQNTFTAAGQLRAQEMANGLGMYGNLAGQMRAQDQSRLQMGNQMAQFNANQGLQRQLGFGNLALGAGDQYLRGVGQGQGMYNTADQNAIARYGIQSGQYGAESALNAAKMQAERERSDANTRMWLGVGRDLTSGAVNMYTGGMTSGGGGGGGGGGYGEAGRMPGSMRENPY